VKCAAQLSTDQ